MSAHLPAVTREREMPGQFRGVLPGRGLRRIPRLVKGLAQVQLGPAPLRLLRPPGHQLRVVGGGETDVPVSWGTGVADPASRHHLAGSAEVAAGRWTTAARAR